MDLKEKIKTIPKEIYNDVQEICEITFMKGTSIYAEELIPERIQEKEKIWKIFLNEKNDTYTIFDLQAYLALEKMIEKDKKKISDIIIELYKECEINELLSRRRLIVLHNIAKYYPKEFNKEILYDAIKEFIDNINKQSRESIVESYIDETYEKLSIIINQNEMKESIFKSSIITTILNYVGLDMIEKIGNIKFKNYDIILKNKNFSKWKKDWNTDDDIIVSLDKFSNNSYLVEILEDSDFTDEIINDYNELQKLLICIKEEPEKDYYLYFKEYNEGDKRFEFRS